MAMDSQAVQAIIQGGSSILGQAANMVFAGAQNRKQRKWNEDMYSMQRRDALADWERQNEYNSPQAQMARLRAAGLNPNLVYGHGATAMSGQGVRSSSVESYKPSLPPMDLGVIGDAISKYYDLKFKQAQTNNLEAQNAVIAQDAVLRAAQVKSVAASTTKTETDTATGRFNLEQSKKLADVSIETANETLRKLKADIDYTLDNNERQAALTANTIAKGAEEILNLRLSRAMTNDQRKQIQAQIKNVQNDTELKRLDIELKRMGIMPGDPMWSRILGRVVGDPKNIWEEVKRRGRNVINEFKEKHQKAMDFYFPKKNK